MNTAVAHPAHSSRSRSRLWTSVKSITMIVLCIAATICILALLAMITLYLLFAGMEYMSLDVFTRGPIPEGMAGAPGGFQNGLVGTGILIAMASAVGIPLGMLAGVYLSEYSNKSRLAAPTRFIADVLTGVPSIVVGILGYELLVVPMAGANGYAGAAALAFIMIPIVTRTTEEMLRLVPHSYREAALALGATKTRTIFGVVLPAATGSVMTGIMLAVARVAGETAPLLFTAAGSSYLELNPSQPFPSLTQQVYNYAMSDVVDERHLSRAGILVLIALVFVINLAMRFAVKHLQVNRPTRA